MLKLQEHLLWEYCSMGDSLCSQTYEPESPFPIDKTSKLR